MAEIGHDVPVVFFALLFVGEDGVGFGDFGEAFAGFGVVAIHVWMGRFGELVEALFEVFARNIWGDLEDVVVGAFGFMRG